MRNLRIAVRLNVIVLLLLVTLAAVVVLAVSELRDRVMAERQILSHALVASAISQIDRYRSMAVNGELPEAEAKRLALEAMKSLQFGGDLYVWVNDMQPVILYHPTEGLIGQNVGSIVDTDGRALFQEFLRLGREQGGGTLFYKWPRPGHSDPKLKVSYVELFQPWDWMAGAGIYVDDVDAATRETAGRFALYAVIASVLSALAVWLLGRTITMPLTELTGVLTRLAGGEEVTVRASARQDEIGELFSATAAFKRHLAEKAEFRHAHDAVQREAHSVFNVISDAVMVTDERNHIKLVNPAFTRITGYSPDEVIGRSPTILASGRHDQRFYETMWKDLADKGQWSGEIWNRSKSGEIFPEWLVITALTDHAGSPKGYVATFNNISERKRHEYRIRWQAEHDSLTGLINRTYFETALAALLREAGEADESVAILFIDLDGFKAVNDVQGHAVGDVVLTVVAKRMHEVVRAMDLVARLGGDEFVIAIPQLHRDNDAMAMAMAIAAKLVEHVSMPIPLSGVTVAVGASIGVALYPHHGVSGEQLLEAADAAMYRRKQAGRGGVTMADMVAE